VYDLDAGPVTITLPEAGTRFMTMIVFDEDHYVYTVVYRSGTYSFKKDQVGSRYAMAAIRILVDPNDPADVKKVNALQDAVKSISLAVRANSKCRIGMREVTRKCATLSTYWERLFQTGEEQPANGMRSIKLDT
jgi:hypothetical protein